jgi:exodeoxyribonuclease VII small subunit
MKSKNIPADIRAKTIKEAQKEINDIIENLENKETKLETSIEKYNRMMQLNNHIQDKFKEKAKEISQVSVNQNKEEKS